MEDDTQEGPVTVQTSKMIAEVDILVTEDSQITVHYIEMSCDGLQYVFQTWINRWQKYIHTGKIL